MRLSAATVAVLAALLIVTGACGPDVIEAGGDEPDDRITDVVPVTEPTETTAAPVLTAYNPGDCLTWDAGATFTEFLVVPCEDDHLVEVTSALDLTDVYAADAELPGGAELAGLSAERCGPVAEAYLDRRLSAEEPGIIPPSPAAWAGGDRTFWCTVGLLRVGGERPAYSGSLRN
jgi:hypothetical protein